MKKYINDLISECIKDEVDKEKEWARLMTNLDSKAKSSISERGKIKKVRFFQAIKYAAAILIGAVLSLSVIYIMDSTNSKLIANYKLKTEKGEKSYLQLPDGTNVWLNSCTTIEYANDYGISNRNISLNGEAYFEVAKNKEIPFIVKTSGGIDVRAVGTAFNVCAYSDESKLTTTLFSGKVIVQPTLTKQEIILEPNQVAVYYKTRNKIEVAKYDPRLFAQWRNGSLSFDMMLMEDITRILERNYNVIFRYENQKIKKLRFSGSFRNGESFTEILEILKSNTANHYEMKGDTVIVR